MKCKCGEEIFQNLGKFKPIELWGSDQGYIYTCPKCRRAYQREKVDLK